MTESLEPVTVVEPMEFDDWTQTEYKLSTAAIAEIAYQAVDYYKALQVPVQHKTEPAFSYLDHDKQAHYISKVVYFITTASNPNGYEECCRMHDLVLEAKLKSGWTYSENYSEDARTDPLLLPYRAVPAAEKVKEFLFRNVVISLLQVWEGK